MADEKKGFNWKEVSERLSLPVEIDVQDFNDKGKKRLMVMKYNGAEAEYEGAKIQVCPTMAGGVEVSIKKDDKWFTYNLTPDALAEPCMRHFFDNDSITRGKGHPND